MVFLMLVPLLAGLEYLNITNKSNFIKFLFAAILIAAISFSAYQYPQYNHYLLYVSIFINLALILNMYVGDAFIKHNKGTVFIFAFYIACPFVLAMLFYQLHHHKLLLFASMVLIWISDSGAYFVGSQIGKNKLFPKISPGKTWEGLIGAGMLTLISAYIFSSFDNTHDFRFWTGFALIIWIMGVYGDLVASHVKRLYQIKDSGTILPGHGGFFDRFDAFIFIMPFILLYITLSS